MVDLQERPATPPEEYGGDERAGFRATGALLIVIGWGFGVLLNLVVHARASSNGSSFGPWVIYPHLGVFADGVLVIGLFAGALGVAMIALSRSMASGPLVLPGYPYR